MPSDDGFENLNWIPNRYIQLYKGEWKTYRLLNLSVPQFLPLQFGVYNSKYLIGLLWGLNE